jgi:hypothetical protein
MARATNTTASMVQPQVNDKELQAQINKAAATFKDEKKVKVSIPKSFEKYTGPTLPVGVNGVFIVLPVDGKEYEINETHAKHLKDFLNNYK